MFRKATPCLSCRIFFSLFVNLMKFRLSPMLNPTHTNACNSEDYEWIANYHLWGASVLWFLVIVHHTGIASLLFLTFRFHNFCTVLNTCLSGKNLLERYLQTCDAAVPPSP